MSWVFWLFVIAFFVVRGLISAAKTPVGSRTRLQVHQQLQRRQLQRRQPQQTQQPGNGWQPPWQPPPPNAGAGGPHTESTQPGLDPYRDAPAAQWQLGGTLAPWSPAPPLESASAVIAESHPGAVASGWQPTPSMGDSFEERREAAREAAAPIVSQLSAATPSERYIGSAALESTLDSTIESSLFAMTPGPLTSSILPGGPALTLSDDLQAQVRALTDEQYEVAAVRLVCEAMDVGILDALRAVQSVGGPPTV